MLDENARANFGLDPSNTISGAIPLRLTGRVGTGPDRDGQFAIEADLTPAQLDGFLPGWVKPAGKPARATFTLTTKPQSIRIDDLLIEGAGGGVKGSIELDGSGELQSANFPSYGFSDGDRTNLKVDRAPDGALHVVMRGDVYDGRGFIKTMTGGPAGSTPNKRRVDIDLDMKLGAVVGYNGEALRSVDLKMSRRAGEIRSFGLTAKIGRDAPLTGDLRGRAGGRQMIVLTTDDGGALFRFTDVYARMTGGQMVIAMDAPSAANPLQQGSITFAISPSMTKASCSTPSTPQIPRSSATSCNSPACGSISTSRRDGRAARRRGARPDARRHHRRLDRLHRDELHLRGTLVPLYGANNLLGQLPWSACSWAARRKAWSASPTRWSASRAIRCCTSIRFRRWRRACCARCSSIR